MIENRPQKKNEASKWDAVFERGTSKGRGGPTGKISRGENLVIRGRDMRIIKVGSSE